VNRKANILVTGGAGFIGSHLVERLLNSGRSVTVVDDLSTGNLANLQPVATHPDLRVVESRISTCSHLDEFVAAADSIFHLAATVGVELVVRSALHVLQSSFRETEVLFQAAAAHKTQILLTSTSEVYGKSNKPDFSEADDLIIGPPDCARWSYACSKLMDEFLALAYSREIGLPVTIARLFNTVGPRQTGRFGMVLPRFIEAARKGEPLRVFGDGSQTRCFCHVSDVVDALVKLQETPAARGEVFNVGSTEEVSILELAHLVIDVLGSSSSVELVPYDTAYAPGFADMLRRKPTTDKLARVTRTRPTTSLAEIIRLTNAALQ